MKCDKKLKLFNLLQFWVYYNFHVRELKLQVDQHPLNSSSYDFEIALTTLDAIFEHDLEELKKLLEKYGFKLTRFDFEISPDEEKLLFVEIRGVVEEKND